ncbi:MAG TPA: ATP-binding protein, partial [Gammaproteobacteria bacterium]|nr:ATP-binding protein [Gammaproteobacteria bacterium]
RALLLRDLFDAADIPIIATDGDGLLARSNTRANKVLGISEKMNGRRFDELFTQKVLHELEQLARGGEPGHARASIVIRGEMRDFDISADPVAALGGAVMTFRDITELSRAVTLKADFAANASHELRTPIASIKGAAETLMGPAKDDERMAGRLIEMIASNAGRLELLARDLLDLSKLEADDLPVAVRDVDLNELMGSVFGELSAGAERRNLRLATEFAEGLGVIRSDPALLKLMLRNLVSNAIKFAHEGTVVRVVARVDTVPIDRTIGAPESLDETHRGLVLEVIDKGVGIPIEHQQRVFERFYQVDEARSGTAAKRGTGLGLAIVKHAARRLGGAVTL